MYLFNSLVTEYHFHPYLVLVVSVSYLCLAAIPFEPIGHHCLAAVSVTCPKNKISFLDKNSSDFHGLGVWRIMAIFSQIEANSKKLPEAYT
jgi:hypothetical protein